MKGVISVPDAEALQLIRQIYIVPKMIFGLSASITFEIVN